jgi:hypothetical protein
MSAPDDSTRPISVAELLARNGTIGSPPVGGRRRRRRRKSDGLSVAELTGEIPVVGTAGIPVAGDDEPVTADSAEQESADEGSGYEESPSVAYTYVEVSQESAETVVVYSTTADTVTAGTVVYAAPEDAAQVADEVSTKPPRSGDPLPSRRRGPERSYDPRPARRSSGAEQMAYDPVDESVDIADLVDEHTADTVEDLRSYLRSSGGTLFSGGTVADDLARRGVSAESGEYEDEHYDDEVAGAAPAAVSRSRNVAATFWNIVVAVLQSLLAVVFGAGLFIAFDQLWRWNNLVALVLSVLVVLALAAVVRVVRKTEDIVSTLTAVAVGLLVTLGPLALQST